MSATVDVLNNEEEREGGEEEEKEMVQQLVLSVVDSYWMTLKEREKMKRLVKILMNNVMCVYSVIRDHGLIDIYKIISKCMTQC